MKLIKRAFTEKPEVKPEMPGIRCGPADRVGLAGYAQNRIFAVPGPGPGSGLGNRVRVGLDYKSEINQG